MMDLGCDWRGPMLYFCDARRLLKLSAAVMTTSFRASDLPAPMSGLKPVT
jgi:hypothetical protein